LTTIVFERLLRKPQTSNLNAAPGTYLGQVVSSQSRNN
jgi:hypothetical protein